MRLNPKEQEKLMLHMAGNLAKERKERGLKLNYVEALAYISSELLELAREYIMNKIKWNFEYTELLAARLAYEAAEKRI